MVGSFLAHKVTDNIDVQRGVVTATATAGGVRWTGTKLGTTLGTATGIGTVIGAGAL